MYEPSGFNRSAELKRAESLAACIQSEFNLRAVVDGPSGFQDGPLFTKIMLFGNGGDLPGQVLISAFGRLTSVCDAGDPTVVSSVRKLAKENGYVFVEWDDLGTPYEGINKSLSGLTWKERYFSEFYILSSHF